MVLLPIPFDKLPCFTVVDVTSNLTTAQRVVPVNRLKSGYRHLRLHNEMDQPLPLSQLFLCRYVVIACALGFYNHQDLLIQTQERTTLATIKVLLIVSNMLQNYPFQCQFCGQGTKSLQIYLFSIYLSKYHNIQPCHQNGHVCG